jgi:type VI secretion system secreted protein VgrG
MEVMVVFLAGDTDRPMVIGAAYNAEHPPPFPLPANKTKSGIRTQSSRGGGGYNELSFEDRKERERVFLRAERDLVEEVKNEHRVHVGADRTIEVDANRIERVGKSGFDIVAGNSLRTVGGDATTLVDGTSTHGTALDHGLTVGGKSSCTIAGSASVRAGGAVSAIASGDVIVSAGRDLLQVAHGSASLVATGVVRVQAAGRGDGPGLSIEVGTDCDVSAGGEVRIQGASKIRLGCGSSTLEIRDGEIVLTADKLTLTGRNEINAHGGAATLRLHDDLDALGQNVTIQSSGAELALASDAQLKGSKVKLGSGGGDSASKDSSSSTTPETPPLLDISVYVGEPIQSDAGHLVLLGEDGTSVRELSVDAAIQQADGVCTWSIDPDEVDQPVEVVWRSPDGDAHVAGPLLPRQTRDAIHASRDREALATIRGATKKSPRRAGPPRSEPEHPGPAPAPSLAERLVHEDATWQR